MVFSVLSLAFLILMGFIVIVGYKMIIKRQSSGTAVDQEKCSICRELFENKALLTRQVGDYKLLYFCKTCIMQLYNDLGQNN